MHPENATQQKTYFRPNVGLIVAHPEGRKVLWCRRIGSTFWQFAQGGVQREESPEDAAWRELHEELGLTEDNTKLVTSSKNWLTYRLPPDKIRPGLNGRPTCIGQRQRWFLFQLQDDDSEIDFNCGDKPEFDQTIWASYWYPLRQIVDFKRGVYRQAMSELAPAFFKLGAEQQAFEAAELAAQASESPAAAAN